MGIENSAELSPSGFVSYHKGDVGIIIAVPHGGIKDSDKIPHRTFGITEGDDHTKELAEFVADSIRSNLGRSPHMIISELKRSKLDPNREIVEAAQGDTLAEDVWREYHGFIEKAIEEEGFGVVIDLHGQSHGHNCTELGYLLTSVQLNNGDYDPTKSSMKNLASMTGKSGKEIIIGDKSLGAIIENEGFRAFPSPRQPSPRDLAYFPGGYTVARYGSKEKGTFDSILVETSKKERAEGGQETRKQFAAALGSAIAKFYHANYAMQQSPGDGDGF